MQAVPVLKLQEFWPWVREGLERVRAKSYTDWIPEDIYGVLRSGNAALYTIGEAEDGFVILQLQSRFTGPCLFVWAICGDLKQHERSIYEELDRLALENKCVTVECQGRKGWERRGYFEPRNVVYVRELKHVYGR